MAVTLCVVLLSLSLSVSARASRLLSESSISGETNYTSLCTWGGQDFEEYPWAKARVDELDYYCKMAETYNNEAAMARQNDQGLDLILLGDSIFQCLRYHADNCKGGFAWFNRNWGKRYNTVNWALGSESLSSLFWRVLNGNNPQGTKAKLAVVHIGSNDFGRSKQDGASMIETAARVASDMQEMFSYLMDQDEELVIIHLGLLPKTDYNSRGKPTFEMNTDVEQGIKEFNSIMKEYGAREKRVRYVSCFDEFLIGERQINSKLMSEGLHPNLDGFRTLQKCLDPFIKQYLTRREDSINYNGIGNKAMLTTKSASEEEEP